ncbi:MAG: hypothetical protein KAT34_07375, partial [Candidatus Aminicenantes bacterium]|nr:hypothetical protein [Candidatus Aminicenantes bacterium]
MKKRYFLFFILGGLAVLLPVYTFLSGTSDKVHIGSDIKSPDLRAEAKNIQPEAVVKPEIDYYKLPLYFIVNQGQVNEKAKFYVKASRYTLWLTKQGLVFDSFKREKSKKTLLAPNGHPSREGNAQEHSPTHRLSTYELSNSSTRFSRDVSRLMFLNSNKNPEIVPIDKAKLKVNYFIGNDKPKWHCDVPTSMAILYKNLYKNIDLKLYGIEKQIEYDWIVKPDGNPADIKFIYKNVRGTRIDKEGNLIISTKFGKLIHKKPVSYQKEAPLGPDLGAQRAVPKEES